MIPVRFRPLAPGTPVRLAAIRLASDTVAQGILIGRMEDGRLAIRIGAQVLTGRPVAS